MNKADFKKTSHQVEREISELVDQVDRALESSSGEAEKKGHFLFTGIASLLVFAAIVALQTFFPKNHQSQPQQSQTTSAENIIDGKDIADIEVYANRIATEVTNIKEIRARIAPSMPIDSNLSVIENSAQDIKRRIQLDKN